MEGKVTMQPFVTIILVNYNGYEDTINCIKSLKKIKYKNYCIIVVDNGSTNTPSQRQIEFLKENTMYIHTEKNLGFAGGNNIGIRRAKLLNADYILLLNNDTVVEPNFLNLLVETAKLNVKVGIVSGKIYWYNDPEKIWYAGGSFNKRLGITTHYRYNKIDNDKTDKTEKITFATGCLWLLPIEVIDDVGMLDESYFLYNEDDDYCCRVLNAGYQILYRNTAIIFHKVSKSTGKQSALTQYYTVRNGLYIIRKYSEASMYTYMKRMIYIIKKILNRELNVKPCIRAFIDFMKNRKGQLT